MSEALSPTHTLLEARHRQKQIGKGLGRLYESLISENLPPGFLELLAQADQLKRARS